MRRARRVSQAVAERLRARALNHNEAEAILQKLATLLDHALLRVVSRDVVLRQGGRGRHRWN